VDLRALSKFMTKGTRLVWYHLRRVQNWFNYYWICLGLLSLLW